MEYSVIVITNPISYTFVVTNGWQIFYLNKSVSSLCQNTTCILHLPIIVHDKSSTLGYDLIVLWERWDFMWEKIEKRCIIWGMGDPSPTQSRICWAVLELVLVCLAPNIYIFDNFQFVPRHWICMYNFQFHLLIPFNFVAPFTKT